MQLTKEQLKQIIREELSEMRIDTTAGHFPSPMEPAVQQPSLVEPFVNKYQLEFEIAEDGEKIIYVDEDDLHMISAEDVPETWDLETLGVERYLYRTGEYAR